MTRRNISRKISKNKECHQFHLMATGVRGVEHAIHLKRNVIRFINVTIKLDEVSNHKSIRVTDLSFVR